MSLYTGRRGGFGVVRSTSHWPRGAGITTALSLVLLSQPVLARSPKGDISGELIKLAPPGALMAMAGLVGLIALLVFLARKVSQTAAQQLFTLALLLVIPLIGLVVWYQPILIMIATAIFIFMGNRMKREADRDPEQTLGN